MNLASISCWGYNRILYFSLSVKFIYQIVIDMSHCFSIEFHVTKSGFILQSLTLWWPLAHDVIWNRIYANIGLYIDP